MKIRNDHILFRHAWLLLTAAWLFTLSFIISNYWSYSSSPGGVTRSIETYLADQETAIRKLMQDDSLLNKAVDNLLSEPDTRNIFTQPFAFFIYEKHTNSKWLLRFWNTRKSLPDSTKLDRPDGSFLDILANGHFETIQFKKNSAGRSLLCVGMIPVKFDYFLQNEYLKNTFLTPPSASSNYEISLQATAYPVRNASGKPLFYLQPKADYFIVGNDWLSLLLRLAGMLFILLFIQKTALLLAHHYNSLVGLITLSIGILIIRVVLTIWDIPFQVRQFELFSPKLFSGMGISSLGMLLVDASLLLWWMRFLLGLPKQSGWSIPIRSRKQQIITLLICQLALLILSSYVANLLHLLVTNSKIPLDVTNFFSLNRTSFFGFLSLGMSCFVYVIASQLLIKAVREIKWIRFPYQLLTLTGMGLAVLTLFPVEPVEFQLVVLGWVVLYILSGYPIQTDLLHIGNGRLIFWICWFSCSLSLLIQLENTRKEKGFSIRLAEKIAWQTDPSSEKVLNVMVSSLSHSFWMNNLHRFKNSREAVRLKDSIILANFSGYLNRYETGIFIFDANGKPFAQSESLAFDTLSTIYEIQGLRTSLPDLRFIEAGVDQFTYLHKREIVTSNENRKAIVFILSYPRRYPQLTLMPDLFRQWDQRNQSRTPFYAYAVYEKGLLVVSAQEYPFSRKLEQKDLAFSESKWMNQDGYNLLWYRQQKDRVILIARKNNSLIGGLTIFSYLFAIFLLLIGLMRLFNVLTTLRFSREGLIRVGQLTIRQQIYGTILLLILVSFIVIGYVTVQFYIERFERSHTERLRRTLLVMADELRSQADSISIFRNQTGELLPPAVEKLARLHQMDLNLYDPEGRLVATSQPLIYHRNVLNNRMDPTAFFQLTSNQKIRYEQKEYIGALRYNSLYMPIADAQQNPEGFLQIPYFSSERDKNQEISFFLVTLLNLIAFIFLMAGMISVLLTTRITASLSWIGQKMRLVTLGKHNEEIQWNRNDEIGALVSEYNKMVQKLEQSAAELARSEREGAWREMARQVAHEIKNPLTPMKLSIQYLQRAVDQGNGNLPDLTRQVAHTLVEQIGHLSKIASEFAQFAQIGHVKKENFDLHDVLRPLIILHQSREDVQINWTSLEQPIWLNADKTQVNRLFTNLIQNAIEAIPENQSGVVSISEKFSTDKILVSIQDNGTGVSSEMAQRIFLPNFTTKSSGTGLGLAICKGIVEKMEGDIWFQSEPGNGTTFYIQLPLSAPPPGI